MHSRRNFMTLAGLGVGVATLGSTMLSARGRAMAAADPSFPVHYDAAEWHKRLTPTQFSILREEGTEPPFSSPLNDQHAAGVFACAGCDQKLFRSQTKFDSGTGWPSFYEPIPGAVGEKTDRSFGFVRTEIHCANCGGHLGHVFDDGPQPTGLRYCMNGAAMKFIAA